jgi:uncharacterized membrane protein
MSALCWGTSDFLATQSARRVGVLATMFFMQVLGSLAFGAVLLVWVGMPHAPTEMWLVTVGISIINMTGTFLLYRSFAVGVLALVAPVASSFAVFTMVLALLSGERPALLALFGALLVVAGVVVVSRPPQGKVVSLTGLPEALGVVVCFGFYFWAVEWVTPSMGVFWPVLIIRVLEMFGALLLMVLNGIRVVRLPRGLVLPVVGASLLSTLAFLSFNLGVTGGGNTAIVTPLSSLSSAVTVLLAATFLRERLALVQWVGVGVILMGVVLVGM